MHLACQRELVSKTPAHASGHCAICNTAYTNVLTTSTTSLSLEGKKCVLVSVGTLVLTAVGAFEVYMYFDIGASYLQTTCLVLGLVVLAVALIFVSRTPTPTVQNLDIPTAVCTSNPKQPLKFSSPSPIT